MSSDMINFRMYFRDVHTFGKARYMFYCGRVSSLVCNDHVLPIDRMAYKKTPSKIKDVSCRGKLYYGDFTLSRARSDGKRGLNIIPLERSKFYRAIDVNNNYKYFMVKESNLLISCRNSYHKRTPYSGMDWDGDIDLSSMKRTKKELRKTFKTIRILEARGLI